MSGCFGWQGKKKVPDGGGVLRWSEGVREFGGGFVGMVRGGRTVLGVGGGGGVGVGSGKGGGWAGGAVACWPYVKETKHSENVF